MKLGRHLMPILAALLASVAAAAPGQSGFEPAVSVADYPHGQFLENLTISPDGSALVTSYVDRRLLLWTGSGAPRTFAALSAHPVSILHHGGRVIVSAHGTSFLEGPGFTATNRLLVLDRRGRLLREVAAPRAQFLNGMAAIGPDRILVADSLGGVIWAYQPLTGEVSEWLRHPLLAVDPAASGRPGVNGLQRRGDWLYLSNSSRGAIYRVRLSGGAAAGALALVAKSGPVDDFAFLPDGSIAAATHGARLIRISPAGAISDIMASGCGSCTSVARLPGGDLLVTTSGDLLEGGSAPARLLRLHARQ